MPAARARVWWKRLSAALNGGVPGCVLGRLVDRRLQGRGRLLGRLRGGEARERHLEEHARVQQLLSDTVSVASIIEIDSLTLRLMPSPGVRATKIPPARPRPTRIRCELASSRRPFAQRRAADAELRRELLLGADPVARLQPFALQVASDLEGDLMARVDPRVREAGLRELGG